MFDKQYGFTQLMSIIYLQKCVNNVITLNREINCKNNDCSLFNDLIKY